MGNKKSTTIKQQQEKTTSIITDDRRSFETNFSFDSTNNNNNTNNAITTPKRPAFTGVSAERRRKTHDKSGRWKSIFKGSSSKKKQAKRNSKRLSNRVNSLYFANAPLLELEDHEDNIPSVFSITKNIHKQSLSSPTLEDRVRKNPSLLQITLNSSRRKNNNNTETPVTDEVVTPTKYHLSLNRFIEEDEEYSLPHQFAANLSALVHQQTDNVNIIVNCATPKSPNVENVVNNITPSNNKEKSNIIHERKVSFQATDDTQTTKTLKTSFR
ncbi:hypothetical protein ABK040_000101 [Willaertia magna]